MAIFNPQLLAIVEENYNCDQKEISNQQEQQLRAERKKKFDFEKLTLAQKFALAYYDRELALIILQQLNLPRGYFNSAANTPDHATICEGLNNLSLRYGGDLAVSYFIRKAKQTDIQLSSASPTRLIDSYVLSSEVKPTLSALNLSLLSYLSPTQVISDSRRIIKHFVEKQTSFPLKTNYAISKSLINIPETELSAHTVMLAFQYSHPAALSEMLRPGLFTRLSAAFSRLFNRVPAPSEFVTPNLIADRINEDSIQFKGQRDLFDTRLIETFLEWKLIGTQYWKNLPAQKWPQLMLSLLELLGENHELFILAKARYRSVTTEIFNKEECERWCERNLKPPTRDPSDDAASPPVAALQLSSRVEHSEVQQFVSPPPSPSFVDPLLSVPPIASSIPVAPRSPADKTNISQESHAAFPIQPTMTVSAQPVSPKNESVLSDVGAPKEIPRANKALIQDDSAWIAAINELTKISPDDYSNLAQQPAIPVAESVTVPPAAALNLTTDKPESSLLSRTVNKSKATENSLLDRHPSDTSILERKHSINSDGSILSRKDKETDESLLLDRNPMTDDSLLTRNRDQSEDASLLSDKKSHGSDKSLLDRANLPQSPSILERRGHDSASLLQRKHESSSILSENTEEQQPQTPWRLLDELSEENSCNLTPGLPKELSVATDAQLEDENNPTWVAFKDLIGSPGGDSYFDDYNHRRDELERDPRWIQFSEYLGLNTAQRLWDLIFYYNYDFSHNKRDTNNSPLKNLSPARHAALEKLFAQCSPIPRTKLPSRLQQGPLPGSPSVRAMSPRQLFPHDELLASSSPQKKVVAVSGAEQVHEDKKIADFVANPTEEESSILDRNHGSVEQSNESLLQRDRQDSSNSSVLNRRGAQSSKDDSISHPASSDVKEGSILERGENPSHDDSIMDRHTADTPAADSSVIDRAGANDSVTLTRVNQVGDDIDSSLLSHRAEPVEQSAGTKAQEIPAESSKQVALDPEIHKIISHIAHDFDMMFGQKPASPVAKQNIDQAGRRIPSPSPAPAQPSVDKENITPYTLSPAPQGSLQGTPKKAGAESRKTLSALAGALNFALVPPSQNEAAPTTPRSSVQPADGVDAEKKLLRSPCRAEVFLDETPLPTTPSKRVK